MRPRKSWSKGAQTALTAFQNQYGIEDGTRAFYAHANKVAAPSVKDLPLNQRVSKVYATGKTQAEGKGGLKKRGSK